MEAMGTARGFLRSMFEHRDDPYEGADLETSRRVTAALLGLSALLSLAFLPLEPVGDSSVGGAGWAIAGALIALGLAGAAMISRRSALLRRPAGGGVRRGGGDRRAQLAGRRRVLGLRGPVRALGWRRRGASAAPGVRPPGRDSGGAGAPACLPGGERRRGARPDRRGAHPGRAGRDPHELPALRAPPARGTAHRSRGGAPARARRRAHRARQPARVRRGVHDRGRRGGPRRGAAERRVSWTSTT